MNIIQPHLKQWKKKTLPLIMQDEHAECGHACIVMISQFWGINMDLSKLRRTHPPSTQGISLRDLKNIAESLGFQTRALRVSLSDIQFIKKPAILHWDMNHFVVLKRVTKHQIIVHDPALGERVYTMKECSASFTGIVLEIDSPLPLQTQEPLKKLRLFDFIKSIKNYHRFIGLLLLMSFFIEGLQLTHPILIQYITDHLIESADLSSLVTVMGTFLMVTLIHTFINYLRGSLVLYVTSHLSERFSSTIMQHIMQQPLTFFTKRHQGDLQSKFQGLEHIEKKLGNDAVETILNGFMSILTLLVMFFYSRLLSTIVLLILVVYIIIRYTSFRTLELRSKTAIQHQANASSIFLETLQSITSIKTYLKEQLRFNAWRNEYIHAINADIYTKRRQNIYHITEQFLFNLEHLCVLIIGAYLVINHTLTLGMLFAFLAYRTLLINKSSSFIQHLFDYQLIQIQMDRLNDLIVHPTQSTPLITQSKVSKPLQGKISLRNIAFNYHPNDPWVFEPINLEIRPNEKIAIVGPSGCGKSTLLKIMMGLLEPTHGHMAIDGCLLQDYGVHHYRKQVAAVLQEDSLLRGSIMENITFFSDEVDVERVYAVSTLACIDKDIEQLTMGYETRIGDLGCTLSSGQKQRILLARALYQHPRVLFLDEASSHLDVGTEQRIHHALQSLDITQVIVAHRQESIQMADRVIQLSHHI